MAPGRGINGLRPQGKNIAVGSKRRAEGGTSILVGGGGVSAGAIDGEWGVDGIEGVFEESS